ncbi:hypothetical protein H2198_001218 [Neophaeococcomyces mojaviensis]|uniref:Uncharacterized protein n=1 Tax=Neophaeococcomyces mojaviensis TaxID=3383035 RepID=A0ACC3AI65_9EURO|nr:hypothetical protein H2198_001218 [Knufia sp. JES_112]
MSNMPSDPFEHILDLEESFYQEGYDTGLTDGEHAGLVEGKVFGIEKGYEKAIDLGRLHGRALVWQMRLQQDSRNLSPVTSSKAELSSEGAVVGELQFSTLPKNSRLLKHVDGLMAITGADSIATDNSDESVAEFDDRLSKAQAKAKVIAAIANESLNPEVSNTNAGIEDARGLTARH